MASISASRIPATAQADTASTHPYTCNTCQVAFRNSELQRGHMRSDWHRYNLKRRVTSLPPITSEVFTEKVLQAQASNTEAATRAAFEKVCTACARTYFSENAYRNHLGSQKHKAKLAALADGPDVDEASSVMSSTFSLGEPVPANDEIDSEAEEEFNEVVEGIKKTNLKDIAPATRRPSRPHHSSQSERDASVATASPATASSATAAGEEITREIALKRCLFCNYDSPSVELNVTHMERIHGMFIPEKPYLVDLEGLIASLFDKINEYHECLYCGKLKPTVFGLQTHMRDTGHCKIPFDTIEQQLEIGDFYDFRSSYSDGEEDSEDDEAELPGKKQSGGVKLGARRPEKITGEDGDEEMEDADGWETDSSASSLDSADLTAVPLDQRTHQYEKLDQHPHHAHSDPRPHHNKDGWHSRAHKHVHSVFYADDNLYLPGGRSAGHRSSNKYFRQNMHNRLGMAERHQLALEAAEGSGSEEDQQVARHGDRERGRALTSRANGGTGMLGVTAEKRKQVAVAEKRSKKVEDRARRKYEWGVNKQNNSQKHFRDPLLQ